ncbi:MAG: efflux RND transporter permease subunit [Patescibacteria group bacterium]|nr:efflux RND transporter permease subunit [Patescibacteria group bacterium]
MSISYLKKIKFDKKLANTFLEKYISNIRIVILLLSLIIAGGLYSYFELPRKLNPEVEIPIINVVTALPQASPSDIETLITIPLEKKLSNLAGLKEINSISQEGVSIINLEFSPNTNPQLAKSEVEEIVDSVVLPDSANDPDVSLLDFENTPIWTFAIRSRLEDENSLNIFVKELKDSLEELSSIDKINLIGHQENEIEIKLKESFYSQNEINPIQISQIIKNGLASYPIGKIKTDNYSFNLSINPQINDIRDIREIIININNKNYYLYEIADISEKQIKKSSQVFLANKNLNPANAILVEVYKTKSAKIDNAQKQASQIVYQKITERYGQFQIFEISNNAQEITDQFNDLVKEFRTTIILVFATISIFLGIKQGLISLLTVPLTYLSAFFFMNVFGISINFLSLFSLLLALGLLVDDTIVVISAMTAYYKTGKFSPVQTGLMVWRDTIKPIWSTTLTTIWSFVPLLLASGIIGEFIKPIPVVVTVTMISSTAIAVLITLPLMIIFLKPKIPKRVIVFIQIITAMAIIALLYLFSGKSIIFPLIVVTYLATIAIFILVKKDILNYFKKRKLPNIILKNIDKGIVNLQKLSIHYNKLIKKVLASKNAPLKIIIAIALYSIIGFLLIPLGLVKSEFFPKSPSDQIFINLKFASGTNLEKNNEATRNFINQIREIEGINTITAITGKNFATTRSSRESENYSYITLTLPQEKEQKINSIQIANQIRDKFSNISDFKVDVIEISGGPPVGADIEFTILGDNLAELERISENLVTQLKNDNQLANIQTSFKESASRITYLPNYQKLNDYGLNTTQIALALKTFISGYELAKTSFGGTLSKEIAINLKTGSETEIEYLSNIRVFSRNNSYTLGEIGEFTSNPSLSEILRENGKRKFTITASVVQGVSATEKGAEIKRILESTKLPNGYSYKIGGVNEENEASVRSIILAMGVAFTLILITMVIQFNSFRQAIVVLIVIPLAVSSVFWAFSFLKIPLSFPALIGILSLFGIVVTNSMFIVDKININLKEKMKFKDAIADAGSSRLEPIILTKLSTVLGLLPITLSDPLWRGLGGAIISGLLLASTIMLLFIPCVYYLLFKPQKG